MDNVTWKNRSLLVDDPLVPRGVFVRVVAGLELCAVHASRAFVDFAHQHRAHNHLPPAAVAHGRLHVLRKVDAASEPAIVSTSFRQLSQKESRLQNALDVAFRSAVVCDARSHAHALVPGQMDLFSSETLSPHNTTPYPPCSSRSVFHLCSNRAHSVGLSTDSRRLHWHVLRPFSSMSLIWSVGR